MQIQKQVGKVVGSKVYYKHVVVISPELIEQSGFKEGDELSAEVRKGEIRLRRK